MVYVYSTAVAIQAVNYSVIIVKIKCKNPQYYQ